MEIVDCGVVGQRVFVFGFTAVQVSGNSVASLVVQFIVLKIVGNPAAIHKDSARLA